MIEIIKGIQAQNTPVTHRHDSVDKCTVKWITNKMLTWDDHSLTLTSDRRESFQGPWSVSGKLKTPLSLTRLCSAARLCSGSEQRAASLTINQNSTHHTPGFAILKHPADEEASQVYGQFP